MRILAAAILCWAACASAEAQSRLDDGSSYERAISQARDVTLPARESPAPLSLRERSNLEAFARLYGYLRWFHPTSQPVDWNLLAVTGSGRARQARGPDELASVLLDVFAGVAPDLVVVAGDEPPPLTAFEGGPVVRWRHWGVFSHPGTHYESLLEPGGPEDILTGRLEGGVAFSMRTATLADAALEGRPAPVYSGRGSLDERLAAVVILWNLMEHFHPYLGEVDDAWSGRLGSALEEAALAAGPAEFTAMLERMLVPIQDGHGRVFPASSARQLVIAAQWDWIEDRLVIVRREPVAGLEAGDIVLSIDGRSVDELVAESMAQVTGSPQHQRLQALQRLRRFDGGTLVSLGIERDGVPQVVTARASTLPEADIVLENRPGIVSELSDGVGYIDLTRAPADQVDEGLARFANARGLILDMRGYPDGLEASVLGHLTDRPLSSAPFVITGVTRPDGAPEGREIYNGGWVIEPLAPMVEARVIFLTDARAISFSETILGIVEAYELGDIVGAPTSGANGNVNRVVLPTGHAVSWTGMHVTLHDGGRLYGVGLQPDLQVLRTLDGVARGEDEVLEEALRRVSH